MGIDFLLLLGGFCTFLELLTFELFSGESFSLELFELLDLDFFDPFELFFDDFELLDVDSMEKSREMTVPNISSKSSMMSSSMNPACLFDFLEDFVEYDLEEGHEYDTTCE